MLGFQVFAERDLRQGILTLTGRRGERRGFENSVLRGQQGEGKFLAGIPSLFAPPFLLATQAIRQWVESVKSLSSALQIP